MEEKFFDYVQILANNCNYNIPYLRKLSQYILKRNKQINKKFLINKSEEFYLDDPNKINVENFVDNLIKRIIYLPGVYHQIDYLINNKKIMPSAYDEIQNELRYQMYKEKSFIVEALLITQSEFFSAYDKIFSNNLQDSHKVISIFEQDEDGNYFKKFVKVPIINFEDDECIYLKILLNRQNYKLIAYVEIGFDYPSK